VAPSGSDRSRAAADSQAAAQTAAAAAGRSLALSFAEPSWIEVRDASGRVLVTGTQPAGSSTVIEGPLPLSAVIGNAGRVTATWRGAPFDLNPHLRQGVARFNIE
jgi:cytoskeleton protein RodZ